MRMVFCEPDSTNVCDERRRMKCQSAVKTKLAMIVLSGLVAGCAPKSPYLPKEYDPAANARLRVYFGVATTVILNRTCQENSKPYSFKANDPIVRGFTNTVIGMPMPDIDEKYYSEYVVMAGIPIDIYAYGGGWSGPNAIGVSMHTREFSDGITAVLEAGKDYETLYQHPNAVLRELVVADGVVRTKPVAVTKFKACENVTVNRTRLPMGGNSLRHYFSYHMEKASRAHHF